MASFLVPPLGESIVEATVSRWRKAVGDPVAAGETLVELETDKITVEVPALESGVLSSQLRAEGDVVNVGDVLGEVAAGAAAATTPAPAATPAAPAPVAAAPTTTDPKASPAARRLAAEQGTDLASVAGTGRGGVIAKADVLDAAKGAPAPAPAAPKAPAPAAAAATNGPRETREKMSTRRKRIAENLLASQHNTAHLTTFNEIDMTAVTALRERVKRARREGAGREAVLHALLRQGRVPRARGLPHVNAQIDGDHRLQALREPRHRRGQRRRPGGAEHQGRRHARASSRSARTSTPSPSARATAS
jgi:2-oxoglutarate dehydrogenase E2 component (dihydrolipoamide succinyltransferase)